jgi:hypothetical protein
MMMGTVGRRPLRENWRGLVHMGAEAAQKTVVDPPVLSGSA